MRTYGFSVIEIVIALALLMIVVTGALSSQLMADYWALSSQLSSEALTLNNTNGVNIRVLSTRDFYAVSSTPDAVIEDVSNPLLESCRSGGSCYVAQTNVLDVSSCAKQALLSVAWKAGARYGTSSVVDHIGLFNDKDLISRGGDCTIDPFSVVWSSTTPVRKVNATTTPAFITGIDVLGDYLYVVASSAPMFRIYRYTAQASTTLQLVATSSVLGNRLNAVDVIRDTTSGRRYAYVVQHTTTNQLLVLDVTNEGSTVVASRSLFGTDPIGSFPQGWRVLAYGGRLYVTTRETAGAELHIFSIANPANPIELTSAIVNLARTVNDMNIQERVVGGILRRYLLLAASAALKEFAVYEVTNDIPIERIALDLPGTENALCVFQNGDRVYLGRQQTSSGPELFQFNLRTLLAGGTTSLAESEVGADVTTIRGIGDYLFLGTNKTSAELQVWQATGAKWNPSVANAARVSFVQATRLAPLGLDAGSASLYTVAQSVTQPEQISVWSIP